MPHCKTPTSFSFEVCITVSMEKVGFADLEEERRFSLILLKMFCHMQKKKKKPDLSRARKLLQGHSIQCTNSLNTHHPLKLLEHLLS